MPSHPAQQPYVPEGVLVDIDLNEPRNENTGVTLPSSAEIQAQRVPNVLLAWLSEEQQAAHQAIRSQLIKCLSELVTPFQSDEVCVGLFDSVSKACATHAIDMGYLLQERSFERTSYSGPRTIFHPVIEAQKSLLENALGHPPPSAEHLPIVVRALLAYSAPLARATRRDIEDACLLLGSPHDNWLFQCIRCTSDSFLWEATFNKRFYPDAVLLESPTRSLITIDFALLEFQKRMQVEKHATFEFIAFKHLWMLSFHNIAVPGPRPSTRVPGQRYRPPVDIDEWWVFLGGRGYGRHPPPMPGAYVSLDLEPALTLRLSDIDVASKHLSNEAFRRVDERITWRLPSGCCYAFKLPDSFQVSDGPHIELEGTLQGKLTLEVPEWR
ncbi:hypothetical protein HMN09_00190200 [Mycena chlorophos]|uniref:Uncharacterized protein n=1 Tax=Mycena chlorophos TaxID=658473 RepID=A0A8H6TNU9_MYCCL|nr:hypothetical protein HMN09_00190200 [Mycena chlorophos]